MRSLRSLAKSLRSLVKSLRPFLVICGSFLLYSSSYIFMGWPGFLVVASIGFVLFIKTDVLGR